MQPITDKVIADFEANNRQYYLFCEEGGLELLEEYQAKDIPKGFYATAYRCPECHRAWREITKLEELQV